MLCYVMLCYVMFLVLHHFIGLTVVVADFIVTFSLVSFVNLVKEMYLNDYL